MYECRNDVDICADLASAARASRATSAWTTSSGCARSAPAPPWTTSTPSASRASRACPRRRTPVAFAAQSARPGAAPFLDAVGQDRDLLDLDRGQPDPLRPRRDPADPDVDPAASRRSAPSPRADRASRGPGRTRFTTTSHHWPGWTSRTCGSTRKTPPARGIARRPAGPRVFNDRGATVVPARVTDTARGVVASGAAWFTPGPSRHRHAGAPTSTGTLASLRRADVQHVPRGGRCRSA